MAECLKKNCNNNAVGWYCKSCRESTTKTFIVVGPSCSGKSTLVNNRKSYGDLIIDFDALFKAISGNELYDKPEVLLPYASKIRNTLIDSIGDIDGVNSSWIIRNKFKDSEILELKKLLNATVIEIRPNIDVCKKRLLNDKSRPNNQINNWVNRIDEWFYQHPNPLPFSNEIIL